MNGNKNVAIVQARMGSTRLPGKILLPLGTTTVLGQVIRRLRCARLLDEIVVATTSLERDEPVVQEAKRLGVSCFRGDENDVLSRYYWCAVQAKATTVVRITADCPLIDPSVIDEMVMSFNRKREQPHECHYLANMLESSFPKGLDLEVFSFDTLQVAQSEALTGFDREHVMPFVNRQPERFRLCNYRSSVDHSSDRWTLDTREDYEFLLALFQSMELDKYVAGYVDICEHLDRQPALRKINSHIQPVVQIGRLSFHESLTRVCGEY